MSKSNAHSETPSEILPRPSHSLGTWFVYIGAQIILHLSLPIILILLLLRGRKEPAHLHGLRERFGFGPTGPKGAVWIYAASLGETRAASPLIRRLRADGIPVLLTHLSPAGLEEGWRLFPEDAGITHRYMPIDVFWAVGLFLSRARPALGVVMEIEIWPAMLFGARRAGVPMVMANGNLIARSIGDGRGLRRHLMKLYREFSHVFTRDADYRERYISLGVPEGRITVVGELKYDQWIDPAHRAMATCLANNWGMARVLMLASSVRKEEELLLDLINTLLAQDKDLGVLWVPRSPQRFDAVAQLVADAGWPVARRGALGKDMSGPIPAGTRVLVGDSIGEMNAYYPVADLVFVGASLVDDGGHNIMEPMAFGKPVLMGPSTYGVAFAAEPAAALGAFESLPDLAALTQRCAALLSDSASRTAMGAAALAFSESQAGAAQRTYAGLLGLLSRARP